ncbi:hypothetical protein KSF_094240 [Reticulibacter mediterranei]|uniref:Uncharacterized protein n=1 Tax=Reticulibacter mediterranei TaxID=2778369 RepID=A0A8J3J0J3_9CHLR|nr:DUF4225 domain-containing protein [Reticulibacter mediterranei]GHO99376.1 hypothetical protein KSF_094240 [Reticulibacter mediterranei]
MEGINRKSKGHERSHSADDASASQSDVHDDFYRSSCFRFAEETTIDGWRSYQGTGKWWSHKEAGGWEEYGASERSMTQAEHSLYREYTQLIKSGRHDDITDEQRAASAKQRRIHLGSSEARAAHNSKVTAMNREAAYARRYLQAMLDIDVKYSETDRQTRKKVTRATINKVYEEAQKLGYREDKETLVRRAYRHEQNPDSYQDSDGE